MGESAFRESVRDMRLLHHFGDLTEANRQLWRSTMHGWHWYPVEQPRPDSDYRVYEVEVTELCARRALTDDEHARPEQQAHAFLAPFVAGSTRPATARSQLSSNAGPPSPRSTHAGAARTAT